MFLILGIGQASMQTAFATGFSTPGVSIIIVANSTFRLYFGTRKSTTTRSLKSRVVDITWFREVGTW